MYGDYICKWRTSKWETHTFIAKKAKIFGTSSLQRKQCLDNSLPNPFTEKVSHWKWSSHDQCNINGLKQFMSWSLSSAIVLLVQFLWPYMLTPLLKFSQLRCTHWKKDCSSLNCVNYNFSHSFISDAPFFLVSVLF